MKIACLTFHNSSNYGSVLQTYALQEVIKSLWHEYEIIDYSTAEKYKYDSLFGRNRELSWKAYFYKLISFPYNYFKKLRFVHFSNKYLNVAHPRHKSLIDLKRISDKYNYYICGSDQIWNATMIRYDPAYFLSFVKDKNKKISYAASFGRVKLSNADRIFYQKYLLNFNKISVREQSGQEIVWECSRKRSSLVLDPTLLFTSRQWRELACTSKIPKTPYILTYCVSYNPEIKFFIRKLKKQTGFKVVGISHNFIDMLRYKAYAIPSPFDFVGLFANASYVVINSFHGTAFSCNLNCNFYTFIKGTKISTTNSRIVDFLKMLGLEKRLMIKYTGEAIDLSPPNFKKANAFLAKNRIKSIKFLKQAMNN